MIVYNKLFSLMVLKGMKKTYLYEIMTSTTVSKLAKNENVTTDVLVKICTALKCDISDIMEIIEIEGEKA